MKRIISLQNILSLVFAVGITCFFALLYPHHLHFQEQYQLFQFDWDYALDVLSIPGGLADWLGRFCVQFFLFAWAGASFLGLVLAAIQRLTALLINEKRLYGLSFVPAVLLLFFLFDENAKFGAAWAVLLSLLMVCVLVRIRPLWLQLTLFFLLLVPVYWAVGPAAISFVLLSLFKILPALYKQKDGLWCVSVAIGALLFAGAIPLAAHHFVNYELSRFFYGIQYRNEWMDVTSLFWPAVWILSFMPLLQWLAGKAMPEKASKACSLSLYAAVVVLIGALFHSYYSPAHEKVMKYDFMARFQQWNRIILTAKEETPQNPLAVTALNLALGMHGQLSEHMFEYRQNGLSGLLPAFVREPISPLTTAEAYYQLGMINTAQRHVFEAQEAIPSYQKSARCYKRLAETNLIMGNYKVARKYLEVLRKTMFYRTWANETLALLGNEEAINRHPEYGRLRSYLVKEDFFFSEKEISQMLGQQLMANPQNRLAFEYLQASYLLTGNLENFIACLEFGPDLGYLTLPKHFQEACILWWSHDHTPNEQAPPYIMPNYVQGLNQYYAAMGKLGIANASLARQYGRTYWHYFFSNNRTSK